MLADLTERPAHVPEHLVVDFDFMRPGPPGSDPLVAWTALHGLAPVVWTPRHGGHWIVTVGEIVPKVLSDWERFSSERAFISRPGRPRGVPLEYNPPEHGPLRKLLAPAFAPKAVKRWADEARVLAIELIEALEPLGRCDFVKDFSKHLPMIILLRILDLPEEHREMLVHWVATSLRTVDPAEAAEVRAKLNAYVDDLVDHRTAEPGEDVLSLAIHAKLEDGRSVSRDIAKGLASALIGGGLDSVATEMTWIAWHLAQHPEHRSTLRSDPSRIPFAIVEYLRRFPISNIARVVREDMEFEGAPLKSGEQILMPASVHGLDPRSFHEPLTVDFERTNSNEHSTLSHGIHRCIGATLAHQEMKIFLEEWLARIPDFGLDADDPPVMAPGLVPGIERLTLRW
jgi:cytochrome P450